LDVYHRILAAAAELFESQGFDRTSVRQLIERAGVSRGALYHYFPSKEAILLQLNLDFVRFAMDKLREVERAGLSAEEKLRHIVRHQLTVIHQYRPQVGVFYQERHYLKQGAFREVLAKREEYFEAVVAVIRAGAASGEFRRDLDPRLVALALFGMCNWAYQWYNPVGPLSPEAIAEVFSSILLDGLRPRA
jgi:AcrR family transcriptional regulator